MTSLTHIHGRRVAGLRAAAVLCSAVAAPLFLAPTAHAEPRSVSSAPYASEDIDTDAHAKLRSYRSLTAAGQTLARPVAANVAAIADSRDAHDVKRPSLFDSLVAKFGLPFVGLAVLGLLARLFGRRAT